MVSDRSKQAALRRAGVLLARRRRLEEAIADINAKLATAMAVVRDRGVPRDRAMTELDISRSALYRLAPGRWPGGTLDPASPTGENEQAAITGGLRGDSTDEHASEPAG